MKNKDILGLSAPLTKLIEVISRGIGTIYEPRKIKKRADANAYRIEKEAVAEAKKIMIEGDAKISILERAKQRLVYQELRRQENIEEIAEKAIEYLDESNTNTQEVDVDWITKFFNYAQDIGSVEVREIWARILSREVEQPNTISIRTLDILRNISSKEAKIFSKLCSMTSKNEIVIIPDTAGEHKSLIGIEYEEIGILKDAGLIRPRVDSYFDFRDPNKSKTINLGQKKYSFLPKDRGSTIIHYHGLTTVGQELCALINAPFSSEYKKKAIAYFEQEFIITKLE